jgi:hypothetical protein
MKTGLSCQVLGNHMIIHTKVDSKKYQIRKHSFKCESCLLEKRIYNDLRPFTLPVTTAKSQVMYYRRNIRVLLRHDCETGRNVEALEAATIGRNSSSIWNGTK